MALDSQKITYLGILDLIVLYVDNLTIIKDLRPSQVVMEGQIFGELHTTARI